MVRENSVITMAKGILVVSPETSAKTSFQTRKGRMLTDIQRILEAKYNPRSIPLKVWPPPIATNITQNVDYHFISPSDRTSHSGWSE